jgi:DAK2 domain fusion protein YloV
MTPVEGTMLTVIRVAAEHAVRVAGRDPSLSAVLEAALIGSREALLDTPNLLLTLRQAGVVDSGGKGLVVTFEGLLAAATGHVIEDEAVDISSALPDLTAIEGAMDHDGYGYCTNFLISGAGIPFEQVRAELSRMGQSAVIVGDEQYVKVHLHTKRPGAALDYALDWGSLSQIKIDNMDSQARKFAEIAPSQTPDEARSEVEIAVIAVASGHGIASAFRELGAADVISGGETMNPSIEEMLGAVNSSPGRAVVLLPNDGNVLMAAEQVSNLSDRPVEVIPTRTVPQGLAALSSFRPDQDLAANVSAMTRRAASALSIEVARADKNALVHDVAVQSGQFIALVDDRLVAAGDDLIDLTLATLADPIRGGPELATVFLGANLDAETRDLLEEHLVARFRDTEFEFIDGGQPHYQLVIALE